MVTVGIRTRSDGLGVKTVLGSPTVALLTLSPLHDAVPVPLIVSILWAFGGAVSFINPWTVNVSLVSWVTVLHRTPATSGLLFIILAVLFIFGSWCETDGSGSNARTGSQLVTEAGMVRIALPALQGVFFVINSGPPAPLPVLLRLGGEVLV